jgi:hypothetical protein
MTALAGRAGVSALLLYETFGTTVALAKRARLVVRRGAGGG